MTFLFPMILGGLALVAVPLVLLVLSIPIPQIIFNRIAFPLQLFASRCAVSAMTFFSIPVLRQGNVIELMPLGASEPKKLAVVEACSGIARTWNAGRNRNACRCKDSATAHRSSKQLRRAAREVWRHWLDFPPALH